MRKSAERKLVLQSLDFRNTGLAYVPGGGTPSSSRNGGIAVKQGKKEHSKYSRCGRKKNVGRLRVYFWSFLPAILFVKNIGGTHL